MKKILLAIAFVLLASLAWAGCWTASDPTSVWVDGNRMVEIMNTKNAYERRLMVEAAYRDGACVKEVSGKYLSVISQEGQLMVVNYKGQPAFVLTSQMSCH